MGIENATGLCANEQLFEARQQASSAGGAAREHRGITRATATQGDFAEVLIGIESRDLDAGFE